MSNESTMRKHATREQNSTPVSPPAVRGSRVRRIALWAVLLLLCPALVGYAVSRAMTSYAKPSVRIVLGDGVHGPKGMAWVPGGEFLMGSDSKLAQANERPAHTVRVHGFWMGEHHVTNAAFRKFVEATGYVTTAEKKPDWHTLEVQLPPGTPRPPDSKLVPGAMVFVGTAEQVPLQDYSRWWRFVPGADWRHPTGPTSSIDGKDDHPVVQVSYEDAEAYAKWAGKRLPTEAEWERAARGGLDRKRYPWGDEAARGRAHTGSNSGPTAVGSFEANAYGLHDMAGNVWEWTNDWYLRDFYPLSPDRNPQGPPRGDYKVIRGGGWTEGAQLNSFRNYADPEMRTSIIGFRCAMTVSPAK